MIFFPLVAILLALSLVLQEFAPLVEWAYRAQVMLIHVTFYCVAVTVPYPVMLLFGFLVGYAYDARYHLTVYPAGSTHSELPFGFTILIFGLMGSLIQGIRPLFRRGRWELPVLMIGICTLAGLVIQYLVISFHRGGLDLSKEMWLMMLMTALFSMLAAPLILFLLSRMAKWTGYQIRLEGITRRFSYGDSL